MRPRELPDRIEKHIHRVPESGCWIWMGELNRNGYGRVAFGGKRRMVHRLVYTLLVRAVADELVHDHLCRVRCCCNPAHLEPVTVQENTLRGEAVLFK